MTRSGRSNVIAILTRFPRRGEVKTRLSPPLSDDEALELHDAMARHALACARGLGACEEARVEVRVDAAFPRVAYDWLGTRGFRARYQGEGDLGDRIRLAFAEHFSRGRKRVVVIGSDCPRLTSAHLRDALARLEHVDVVLGPTGDGGYYLVALRTESAKRSVPVLFTGIAWSTETVLAETVAIANAEGLTYALLETLPDVDRPEDVADARAALAASELPATPSVSVVIPALDDAGCVAAAVTSARDAGAFEVVVADGGSQDATREAAEAAGARVIRSEPGRALQMNAGAAETTGDVLLFLHADTTLPPDACALACEALARPGAVAGGFSFGVPSQARHARLLTFAGSVRPALGGAPWGDQAPFMPRWVFDALGGYPEFPAMEDYESGWRLKHYGTVVTLRERALTSARVWDEFGLVWPTLVNAACIFGYLFGVSPDRLAGWRRGIAPPARRQRSRP